MARFEDIYDMTGCGTQNRMFLTPELKKDQITGEAKAEYYKLKALLERNAPPKPRKTGWKRRAKTKEIELNCDWCGGIIHKSEAQAAYSKKHYCNNDCKHKGHRREY